MEMEHVPYEAFVELGKRDHEQLIVVRDEASGLRAFIGIHNTTLGPALGGCRMFPYASEKDALVDVLRLSRGMTYKAAVSGLNLGGGKCVVIGDPKTQKSELLWRALGRFIEGLGGRYITAEDAGTNMADMEHIRMETSWVMGISRSLGGSGDPSPVTARGVFSGLKAAVEKKHKTDNLKGMKVAVQGCGHVGRYLVGHLVRAGCSVFVADLDEMAVAGTIAEYPDGNIERVPPNEIYDVDCDIFAPCAMGGSLNADTIPRLKCSVVAGAANNQLGVEKEDGARLVERDILYAPDFVINAGGLINVANELEGYNRERALNQADGIRDIMLRVFERAASDGVPTWRAANNLAIDRIEALGKVRRTWTARGSTLRVV